MRVTSFTEQAECNLLLDAMGVRHVAQPTPPQGVCDFICQIADGFWFVGTNNRGNYTIHVLEDATKSEAWAFFENLRGPGNKYIAPRMTFLGGNETADPSAN